MTKKVRYILFGVPIMLLLWISSWILLSIFLHSQESRGQFGDMFGAVNSLFSGFALCGVVYSIVLQNAANNISNYQFQFNRTLDIINGQVDIFNNRILEFNFKDLNDDILGFMDGILYYKQLGSEENRLNQFVTKNRGTIGSMLPFIFYSNQFAHEIIDQEKLKKIDSDRLKKLYFRNQNRFTLDFHSMNTQLLKLEKDEIENRSNDLKEIATSILNLKISMTKGILEDDYC
jgi:hypothetical protein